MKGCSFKPEFVNPAQSPERNDTNMSDFIWEQIEHTGLPEMPEIGKMQIRNAVRPMSMEMHSDKLEFLLLYSGCKRMWVENQRYDMQGGDLLLIFPGENHGAEDVIQNRSALCYFLMPNPTECEGFCMLKEEERRILWERLKGIPDRKFKVPPIVRKEMDSLFGGVDTGDPLSAAHTRVRLMEFLFQVMKASEKEGSRLPADIGTVIRYIRENRNEMPDISRMAALINLSEPRFKQKFKQATGVPPAEFMVREKVTEAKELLQDKSRTITSIAMELGFSSSQHFSVLFKKYVGESPLQYRRDHEFVL